MLVWTSTIFIGLYFCALISSAFCASLSRRVLSSATSLSRCKCSSSCLALLSTSATSFSHCKRSASLSVFYLPLVLCSFSCLVLLCSISSYHFCQSSIDFCTISCNPCLAILPARNDRPEQVVIYHTCSSACRVSILSNGSRSRRCHQNVEDCLPHKCIPTQ